MSSLFFKVGSLFIGKFKWKFMTTNCATKATYWNTIKLFFLKLCKVSPVILRMILPNTIFKNIFCKCTNFLYVIVKFSIIGNTITISWKFINESVLTSKSLNIGFKLFLIVNFFNKKLKPSILVEKFEFSLWSNQVYELITNIVSFKRIEISIRHLESKSISTLNFPFKNNVSCPAWIRHVVGANNDALLFNFRITTIELFYPNRKLIRSFLNCHCLTSLNSTKVYI